MKGKTVVFATLILVAMCIWGVVNALVNEHHSSEAILFGLGIPGFPLVIGLAYELIGLTYKLVVMLGVVVERADRLLGKLAEPAALPSLSARDDDTLEEHKGNPFREPLSSK